MSATWLTRPIVVFSPTVKRALHFTTLLVIVLVVISPVVITLAWHVRHGNTVIWRGKPVFVPTRWIVEDGGGNETSLSLTKLPLMIPLDARRLESERISLMYFPLRPGDHLDGSIFESQFRKFFAGAGDVVSGRIGIGTGQRQGFCLEAMTLGSTEIDVSCFFSTAAWQADLIGGKQTGCRRVPFDCKAV